MHSSPDNPDLSNLWHHHFVQAAVKASMASLPVIFERMGSISSLPWVAASSIKGGLRLSEFSAALWICCGCAKRNCKQARSPPMTALARRRYRVSAISYLANSHFNIFMWIVEGGGQVISQSPANVASFGSGCWRVHSWHAKQFPCNQSATSRCPCLHAKKSAFGWQPLFAVCSHFTCAAWHMLSRSALPSHGNFGLTFCLDWFMQSHWDMKLCWLVQLVALLYVAMDSMMGMRLRSSIYQEVSNPSIISSFTANLYSSLTQSESQFWSQQRLRR